MKSPDSVFNVLAEEGLTTLEVFYNRQEDKFILIFIITADWI